MGKRILMVRNRTIWFRMSEAEFQQAVAACDSAGCRSMSDFIRDTVLHSIKRGAQAHAAGSDGAYSGVVLADQMSELRERVGCLESQIASLKKRVVSCELPVVNPEGGEAFQGVASGPDTDVQNEW